MFFPSGEHPPAMTSSPSLRRTPGATADAAPLAQSSATFSLRGKATPASAPSRNAAYSAPNAGSVRTAASFPAPRFGARRTTSSRRASQASEILCPIEEKILIPLSWYGLCEAEITTPALKWCRFVMVETADVGMTPADIGWPPASRIPPARAASIHGPDSRVSRPMSTSGARPSSRRSPTRAPPRAWIEGASRGYSPATARMPSVPNNLFMDYSAEMTTRTLTLVWAVVRRSSGLGRMRSASNSAV